MTPRRDAASRLDRVRAAAGRAVSSSPRRAVARFSDRTSKGGGFTLIETLVAVGAIALLAVGISAVFKATGDTVRAGNRLSHLNAYAGRLERQMRADFEAMTRDGFLVIHHQWADVDANGTYDPFASPQPDAVPNSADDRNPRPRRIDEIVFFAGGDFTSLRDAVHPGVVARSDNARVYYGHGHPWDPDDPRNAYYDAVDIADPNQEGINDAPALGAETWNGREGSNRYAGDWILMRHATLLAPPTRTAMDELDPPPHPAYGPEPDEQPDNEVQISFQSAAPNLFRIIAGAEPDPGPGDDELVRDRPSLGAGLAWPHFGSGVIDIAASDLTQVRAVVLDAQPLGSIATPYSLDTDDPGSVFLTGENPALPGSAAGVMREWMREAFPTDSESGYRMRCETASPNLFGFTPTDVLDFSNETARPLQRHLERSDQAMLTAFNFVPHCTEFIVEWSFGVTDQTTGALLWHGLDRWIDTDGDGTPETLAASPYKNSDPNGDRFLQGYMDRVGDRQERAVPEGLIGDPNPPANTVDTYSHFGYLDPTYTHPDPATPVPPATLEWAWPTLVRVTLTLADPHDPRLEQTFQFIFDTPGNPGDPGR